jgi:hypothetical protein
MEARTPRKVETIMTPTPSLRLSQRDPVQAGVSKNTLYQRKENFSGGNFKSKESLKLIGMTMKEGKTRKKAMSPPTP